MRNGFQDYDPTKWPISPAFQEAVREDSRVIDLIDDTMANRNYALLSQMAMMASGIPGFYSYGDTFDLVPPQPRVPIVEAGQSPIFDWSKTMILKSDDKSGKSECPEMPGGVEDGTGDPFRPTVQGVIHYDGL